MADHQWQTGLTLTGRKNQHFRLDAVPGVVGGPGFSYGDRNNDGVLEQKSAVNLLPLKGRFLLSVNDETLSYSLKRLDSPKQSVHQVNFSGSNGKWALQPMTLVADHTWYIKSRFASKGARQFRFVTDSSLRFLLPSCLPFPTTASSASSSAPATLVAPACDCGVKGGCVPPSPYRQYGDNNRDGVADFNGKVIPVPYKGDVLIRYNDQTRRYSVELP